MKRSRGYFCKQSNVLVEAQIKKTDKFIEEVLRGGVYNQKAKCRPVSYVTLRSDGSFLWES